MFTEVLGCPERGLSADDFSAAWLCTESTRTFKHPWWSLPRSPQVLASPPIRAAAVSLQQFNPCPPAKGRVQWILSRRYSAKRCNQQDAPWWESGELYGWEAQKVGPHPWRKSGFMLHNCCGIFIGLSSLSCHQNYGMEEFCSSIS